MESPKKSVIGERVRQARLARGLTQDDLVSRLSALGLQLTKAGLSKYERGHSCPSSTVIRMVSRALAVQSEYFLRGSSVTMSWLRFRRHSRLSKQHQEQIKARAQEIAERQVWLQETLYPHSKCEFPPQREVSDVAAAEKVADELREAWGLSDAPIESMTSAIEDRGGIVVEYTPSTGGAFDGLSAWANDKYPLAVVSADVTDDRKRFDLAHELAHLLMDCRQMTNEDEEKAANRFAGAFLAPSSAVQRELGARRRNLSLQELAILKQKYGLSMQGWIFRARDLGIIDSGHFNVLFRHFSSKGWRKKEPVKFSGLEFPTRLKQMTLRALAEGVVTQEKAEHLWPGCTQEDTQQWESTSLNATYALELIKKSADERDAILAAAASVLKHVYETGGELTDFDAFREEDLHE